MVKLNVKKVPINLLDPNPWNPNKMTKKVFEAERKSIKRFGFVDPVTTRIHGDRYEIIDGEHRWKAAIEEGFKEVSINVLDLTDEEAKTLTIIMNETRGKSDEIDLAKLLAELQMNDEYFGEGLPWSDNELIRILRNANAIKDTIGDDDIIEDVPCITQIGDIYELTTGKVTHKIICGDAGDQNAITKIMKTEKADLLITDPPYNVNYSGKTKAALKIKGDKQTKENYKTFLENIFKLTKEIIKAGAAFYIWHADSEGFNVRNACQESGLYVRQCLIWKKQTMVMGRQDYQWQHEPCLYGWKEGAAHLWYADRKQTTILDYSRPSRNAEHPTMKPVDLMAYLISNSSKEEDIIYDPFMGSGTTIIACEKLNRNSRGMEIDPKYCDVIVYRFVKWAKENNKKCKIKKNGVKYNVEEKNA